LRNRRSAGPAPRPGFGSSGRAPKPAKIGLLGIMGRIFAALLLGWCGGFLWFSLTLPAPAPLGFKTDAVVVLTGGKGRLKRGLAVIEAGSARRMLISGVDRNTTRKQLAAAAGVRKSRLGTSDLGYEAVDTRSNAEETARWVAKNRFTSIRLVTSAGHMRRARLELSRVLPRGISVVSDAVAVEARAPSIAAEYSKYLLRRAALAMGEA
jgi:uncharacterized SAM-binding protein YcdF (DUF218 family)